MFIFKIQFKIFFLFLLLIYNQAFSFYFGPQITYHHYTEQLPSGLNNKEKGAFYGFRGGLSPTFFKIILLDLGIDYTQGKTKQQKDLLNNQNKESNYLIDNTLLNVEGSLGLYLFYKGIFLKPFLGVGYYIFERKLEKYSEFYHWSYFPIGASLSLDLYSQWDLGLEVKIFQTKWADLEIKDLYPQKQEIDLQNKLQYSLKIFNKFHLGSLNTYISIFYKKLKIGSNKNEDIISTPLSTDKIMGIECILEHTF